MACFIHNLFSKQLPYALRFISSKIEPAGIWTQTTQIKSLVLYQVKLQVHSERSGIWTHIVLIKSQVHKPDSVIRP